MTEKLVLFLDGSLHGQEGNTHAALCFMREQITYPSRLVSLHNVKSLDEVFELLKQCRGLVIGTGTYWDSWGSPMQVFLERLTEYESDRALLGKPAVVLVTMHSMGGKSVLSRLMGVINDLGAAIPPCGGMVLSYAAQEALKGEQSDFKKDLWQLEECRILGRNLTTAIEGGTEWEAWPEVASDAHARWLKVK